jgi:esterase/lipase superfamily enzyme/GNAT superfamily N-acetyltransferase
MPSGIPYQYFEERPWDQQGQGQRKRNVGGRLASGVSEKMLGEYRVSRYLWWQTREFEGRAGADEAEGVWPINHSRVFRYYGDPGESRCPDHSKPSDWPANIQNMARQFRLHHYFRVWNAAQCRDLVLRGVGIGLSLEVTEEWHDPPDGIIEIPDGAPVLGSHAVHIMGYDGETRRFVFPNSWGEQWGKKGFGALSADIFDRFIIEAWCKVGTGLEPPVQTKSGLVCLLWKSALSSQEVHGREIVDAATGERLAWAFLVRRGNDLEIEEFFVWPTHRRKGYARKLVELIHEFIHQSGLQLRAWVPFADAGAENRQALLRLFQMLGLHIRPSPIRSAAFLATAEEVIADVVEPRMPERPASIRKRLDPETGTRLYTVWFGTNRSPVDPTDPSKGFSVARDDKVHYGVCKVSIPRSHRLGSIGSSWWRRWIRWTDDRLCIEERAGLTQEDFWRDVAKQMHLCGPDERQGLVFLHGYNVDFDEAAIRAAQIGCDLKVPGVTAFFSWPSCGTLLGYLVDEATIEASEHLIAQFLSDFVSRSGASRVHLIAHSMGNRGLTRALHRLVGSFSASQVPFGQIILAAPDIDSDLFGKLADVYPRFGQRTTLYASPKDRAVGASHWLHGYPRAGLTPPVTVVPGVDTVQVPSFDALDLIGHGYFAEAEALLHDIFDLIRRNADPADRQRLTEARHESGSTYWVMDQ